MFQHIEPRTLYLRIEAGLGNRLSPILFAVRLLELQYFDRLIIRWGNLNCSQFQLSDLFNIHSNRIEIVSEVEPPTPWIWGNNFEMRPAALLPWRYCTSNVFYGYSPIIAEQDRSLSNDEIINQVVKFYPRYLTIRPELLQIANEFPITNEYIGIHCRRTDVDLNEMYYFDPIDYPQVLSKLARIRDEAFTAQLSKVLEDTDKLFVASDDEITKEYYKSKFAHVVTRPSKLPINLWDIHPDPKKFGYWGQMLRTRNDIVDAFIELLILSRCSMIITDYASSFAVAARYLMGSNVYRIKPGRPILWRLHKS